MKIDTNGTTAFLHIAGGTSAVFIGLASLMVGWASLHHYQDMGESSLGGDWTMRVNVLTNDVVVCSTRYGCSPPVDGRPAVPNGPSPFQRHSAPPISQEPS